MDVKLFQTYLEDAVKESHMNIKKYVFNAMCNSWYDLRCRYKSDF